MTCNDDRYENNMRIQVRIHECCMAVWLVSSPWYPLRYNVYLRLLRRHPTYKTKTIPVYRDTTHFLPFSTTYRLLTGSLVGFCVTFLLKQVIHRSNVFKIEGVDTPRSCSLDRPLVVHIVARTGAIHMCICVMT